MLTPGLVLRRAKGLFPSLRKVLGRGGRGGAQGAFSCVSATRRVFCPWGVGAAAQAGDAVFTLWLLARPAETGYGPGEGLPAGGGGSSASAWLLGRLCPKHAAAMRAGGEAPFSRAESGLPGTTPVFQLGFLPASSAPSCKQRCLTRSKTNVHKLLNSGLGLFLQVN